MAAKKREVEKESREPEQEPSDKANPPGYDADAGADNDDDEPNEGKDYVTRSTLRDEAAELYEDVVDGFIAKRDRDDDNEKFWNVYNCVLGDEQSYSGRSDIFVPVVRDAIEARTLRFTNALFPSNARYVECISSTDDDAHALQALINHYVRECRLRETMGACLRAGDVTGQYSIYAGWSKKKRTITQRVTKAAKVDLEGIEVDHPDEKITDVEQVTLSRGTPDLWVIPDEDLCVLPATVDNIDDADTVGIVIRVTKSWMRERKNEFTKKKYKQVMDMFKDKSGTNPERPNPEKARAKDAGVKSEKGSKQLAIFEIWSTMEIEGDDVPTVTRHVGAGPENVVSIKKNPYWGQKCPAISAPLKKVAGSFWGISPSAGVEKMAYQCNDAINMGMDSAQYALTPIVMSDPASNPRIATMVLEMAALWEVDPKSTQILSMPKLWQDALQILTAVKAQIQESLGLNPAMMPSGQSKKTSQAAVAQEQAVALEGTADAVRVLETSILTDLANRIFEYDQQFRDKDMSISHYGELGYEAVQETVPPVQFGSRYNFQWSGTAQAQGAQRIQQMISAMNVLRGIPPEQLNGRMLDIGPVADAIVDQAFGPRLGPRVLRDVRSQLGVDPAIENSMMVLNQPITISPLDDDAKHIAMHSAAAAEAGDPYHQFAAHIHQHQAQMQKKAMAAGGQPGSPGVPGGGPPGVPGSPKPGTQPAGPRAGAQAPPGAVRPGAMSDPSRMPAGHA